MVTKRDLEVAIAAYGLGRILPAGSTRAAVRATIPKLVRAGRVVAPVAGRTVAALAAANPVSTGLGLGASFLASGPGQTLLQSAEERGAADRIRAQQALDLWVYENITRPQEFAAETLASPQFASGVKSIARKKLSKYNKAVKASMAAVKASKFSGKKGTISSPKTVFKAVNRVASAINKGKKVSSKGISGVIARASRKILKKDKK